MMKLTLIALALFACWADGVNGENAETAWEHHKAHFPVSFSSSAERKERERLFLATHDFIEQHNKGNHTFKMEHNQFSTMTSEEKQKYLGLVPEFESSSRGDMEAFEVIDWRTNRDLPDSVDLRTNQCMNSVKNQGSCGSCWAFAATAPVEFGTCLKTGSKVVLSEQQIVDCSKAKGCSGGSYTNAWPYVAKNGGQDTSASYPYTAKVGTCQSEKGQVAANVEKTYTIIKKGDVNTMMTLLSQNRLISVGFQVIKSLSYYKSGVYSDKACTGAINHAVTLVGYGTLTVDNIPVPYWILRNSWGSSWASGGYALFLRGSNMCNIEAFARSPVVV